MFDHVTIRASDRGASEQFYATVLASIGIERTYSGEDFAEWDDFSLAAASPRHPVTRRLHIAWLAPSRERVDEFWRVGTAAGYRGRRAGERPQYSPGYYGAFLLDPDGNSTEAVRHGEPHTAGDVDHLWIRVADLAAAKRLYETIGPFAGFEVGNERPDRVSLVGDAASFSVVPGDAPTEHVHLAFPRPREPHGRRLPPRRARRRIPRQRGARRARGLPPGLLRRVRPRPRRQQRRGREPQPGLASRASRRSSKRGPV